MSLTTRRRIMSGKRLTFLILTLLMATALALTACQPAAAPAPQATQPAAAQATQPAAAQATQAPPPPKCDKLPNAPTVNAGEPGSADKPIVITFVPSGDTGKITKAGTAIADCLTQMTGLNYKIEVGTSFAASIEAMGADKAQVGFLNTFSAVLAKAKYGIEPALLVLRKYNTNSSDPDNGLSG